MAARGAVLGLKLGLGAFVLYLLLALVPVLVAAFMLLGVASLALLHGATRRDHPGATRTTLVGLLALVLGFLVLLVSNAFFAAGLTTGDWTLVRAMVWTTLAAEVAIAGGFYAGAAHLAGDRSQTLLGLAFGAAAVVSALAAFTASGAVQSIAAEAALQEAEVGSEAWTAWRDAALGRFIDSVAPATQAKAVPYILFAWAYATVLGRLRSKAAAAQLADPPAT